MDQVNKSWNVNSTREHLLPIDAEVVRQIPLPLSNLEHSWAWSLEKSGNFSARTAYRMLVHTRNRREAWLDGSGSSSSKKDEKSWTKLWKYKLPGKIKVFAWILARQSLSTADVLHHKNMSTEDKCLVCGREDAWRHSLLE